MVRLEAVITFICTARTGVSIPVWFDWKKQNEITLFFRQSFQFQYGSIGRKLYDQAFQDAISFQFQYGSIGSLFLVLRPMFFSVFQFQYGSIGSLVYFSEIRESYIVSIPVWFDWKIRLLSCY